MRKTLLSLAALAALGLTATPVMAAHHEKGDAPGMSAAAHADKDAKKAHKAERKASKDTEKSASKDQDRKKKEMKERKDKTHQEGKKKMKESEEKMGSQYD